MSTTITEDLGRTAIAGWYTRLADNQSPKRNHWNTKTIYYRAVAGLLAGRPGTQPTWKAVVGAVRPRGSRSTFYEVAGPSARHGMVAGLIAEGSVGSIEIALLYRRPDPVEQLIDETKVWSFWSYRQHFADLDPDAAGLETALQRWAAAHPALASANAYRPPACAVEDLALLNRGRLAAMRAESRLAEILRNTAPH